MADYMVQEDSGARAIRYGGLAVALHWLTAVVILVQVGLGFTFDNLPKGSPERAEFFLWHKTVGVTILLLALTRLAVRLIDAPPPYPADFPKWERRFAVWNHRAFYFLIIALPLTGLAAVSKRGAWTDLVYGMNFPTLPFPALGGAHEVLVWTTIALLVLHVGAALKNQFVNRGPVADRMPPFRSTRR